MKTRIPVNAVVIDDDASVCQQLAGWLESASYQVRTFTDPAEGLHHLSAAPSDVALVDLRMPSADGTDVIAALTKDQPGLRILALSAFPDAQQVAEAYQAGAHDLIQKPMSEGEVLQAMQRQLSRIGIAARTEQDFNRLLGARIRTIRKAAGRTQTDLAAGCQITAAQLSQIELGKTATSTWTLARICGNLKIPMHRLFEQL